MINQGTKTSDDKVAMVRACYEAYVKKDRAAIEKLIAEEFHFSSPRDNRIDRATYFHGKRGLVSYSSSPRLQQEFNHSVDVYL